VRVWSSLLVFLVTVTGSAVGIELFRRNSLRRGWIDRPNERSSHTQPTPRGAGLVIVIVSLFAYIAVSFTVPGFFSWGYFFGAVLIALISWADDLYSIPFIIRLLTHFAAAVAVVINLGHFESFGISQNSSIQMPMVGVIATVIWIVWVINAYNFMDGIDGIAGIQALIAAAAWAAVSVSTTGTFAFMCALAGAVLGFLLHNWQPARVFMGDVGSAFLGFTFASIPLTFAREVNAAIVTLPIAAVVFLWPFMLDTVFTLLGRAINGERVWLAHRKHLYQRLVVAGFSHAFVSSLYGAFAVFSSIVGFMIIFVGGNAALYSLVSVFATSILFVLVIWFKTANKKPLSAGPV